LFFFMVILLGLDSEVSLAFMSSYCTLSISANVSKVVGASYELIGDQFNVNFKTGKRQIGKPWV